MTKETEAINRDGCIDAVDWASEGGANALLKPQRKLDAAPVDAAALRA